MRSQEEKRAKSGRRACEVRGLRTAGNSDEKFLCEIYDTTLTPVENSEYFSIDPFCLLDGASGCQTVTREVCEPTEGAACQVLCQKSYSETEILDGRFGDKNDVGDSKTIEEGGKLLDGGTIINPGELINCQEVCSDYVCETVTSYHSGTCKVREECIEERFSENPIAYIDPESVTIESCEALGACNQFGCSPIIDGEECGVNGCPSPVNGIGGTVECGIGYCNLITNDGPGHITIQPISLTDLQYFQSTTLCSEDLYCDTLECNNPGFPLDDVNLVCIGETAASGNPLIINITENGESELLNSYFQCHFVESILDGDPICEYSFSDEMIYDESKGYCWANAEAVCDWSVVTEFGVVTEDLVYGCDNITFAENDSWSMYNSECVDGTPLMFEEYGGLVYDGACCYAFTLDSFETYDDGLSSENVIDGLRVY